MRWLLPTPYETNEYIVYAGDIRINKSLFCGLADVDDFTKGRPIGRIKWG